MKTRAKVKCISKCNFESPGATYEFQAVYGDSEENKKFFVYTPVLNLKIGIINESVAFVPGKSYYLDFTECE